MTKKIYLAAIVFISLLTKTSSCHGQEDKINSITFIQGDSLFRIVNRTDSIVLGRKPFAIRYFGKKYDDKTEKFYSAQIAILDNPADTISLGIGKNTNNIPYFEPGTGMAPGENGRYDTVFIENTGHHYLTYENENEKRVTLISINKDILELEWKISAAVYQGNDMNFSDLRLGTLFFVIFIDNNLNDTIDEGELKVVKTTFK